MTVLKGPAGAAQAFADLLYARLPAEVARLEAELGPAVPLSEEPPHPVLDATPRMVTTRTVDPDFGEVSIVDYPFVVVLPSRLVRADYSRGRAGDGSVARMRYAMGLVLFAAGQGYGATQAVRDRLLLATRETLLRWPKLGLGADSPIELDPNSLRESYAPTGIDDRLASHVTAARLDVEAVLTERVAPVDPGYLVETVVADTEALPLRAPSSTA